MIDAYHALCELWTSLEYQEKSAMKRKLGVISGTRVFRANGYVYMGH
jgi:hypothetical protein